MPKKLKEPIEVIERRNRIVWLIIKISTFLVCAFIFTSLCIASDIIRSDYQTMVRDDFGFLDFFRDSRPQVNNPVGLLGALLSYFFLYVFGHSFSLTLFSIILLLLTFKFANYRAKIFDALCVFIATLVFNINLLHFHYVAYIAEPYTITITGKVFFERIFYAIDALIGKIGTPILCIVAVLLALRLVVPYNPFTIIVKVFIWLRDVFADGLSLPKLQPKLKIQNDDDDGDTDDDDPVIVKPQPVETTHPVVPADDTVLVVDGIPIVVNTPEKLKIIPRKQNPDDTKYQKPDVDQFLLKSTGDKKLDKIKLDEEIKTISRILIDKLKEFEIVAKVLNVNVGPIITQYELEPAPGIKVSKFTALSDDLALALKAKSIRVQAPIPGRGLVGVEIPNKQSDIIYMRDIFLSSEMVNSGGVLTLALGKDIAGRPIATDLAKMPHLLIAGATGSGKSVCINTIICSLLLRCTPDEVRLVMIDPKRIELSGYEGIPHLIQSVVTEPEDALNSLNWAVYEMERRYELLQEYKVRDLVSFNQKIDEMIKSDEAEELDKLPYIVVIVDEFADLIMTAGKEIELPITRLAQMARAVGIHLILATQRPSTKVITGVIKANFPARIAFRVSAQIDSRVILDSNGAEKLLGRGDMLFLPPGKPSPERIHGAYLSDSEIEGLCDYLRTQPKPHLTIQMEKPESVNLSEFEYDDELFPEAVKAVVMANTASVSMLQRHFKIGYARAGRLIDLLENAGVIGPYVGSKSREVLMKREELD
jgi:S-DNA-T family DNA segregation ATPase FtsK/SpoIIIE